jgi:Phosphopantetheine attachment site
MVADEPESRSGLAQRLDGLPRQEQQELLERLVRGWVGAVLKYPAGEEVPVDDTFRDMGFVSLTPVELRHRIAGATGVELQLTDVLVERQELFTGSQSGSLANQLSAMGRFVTLFQA